jgi:hypothetical protein
LKKSVLECGIFQGFEFRSKASTTEEEEEQRKDDGWGSFGEALQRWRRPVQWSGL